MSRTADNLNIGALPSLQQEESLQKTVRHGMMHRKNTERTV
jgi:hypothetical protein